MNITQNDILNDIAEYEARISAAKVKLSSISTGFLPYPEHKKREKKRDDLQDEVEHVESLIKIAKEALEIE